MIKPADHHRMTSYRLADKSRRCQFCNLTVFTVGKFDGVHIKGLLLLLDQPNHGLGPASPLQPELVVAPPYGGVGQGVQEEVGSPTLPEYFYASGPHKQWHYRLLYHHDRSSWLTTISGLPKNARKSTFYKCARIVEMLKNYLKSHMTRNSNLENGKLPPWKGFHDNNGCDGKEGRITARTDSRSKKSIMANWVGKE